MPHDCKGREIKPGDIVLVPFKVTMVSTTKDYCNVQLESCASMPPEGHKTCIAAINTQQTIRANPGDDVSFHTVNIGLMTTIY